MAPRLAELTSPSMPVIYQLIYFVTSFLMLSLAAMIFFRRSRQRMVQSFALFILSVTGWVISLFFFYSFTEPVTVLLMGRLNFFFAEFIAFFSFLFAYYFPQPDKKISRRVLWMLFGLSLAFAAITLTTDLVDENEIVKGISRETHFGPLYYGFIVHFLAFSIAGLYLLARKYRKFRGNERKQIIVFALGWLLTVAFGVTTNIFIPLLTGNYDVQNLGPLALFFLVVATGYAVAKHELLKIEVLAAEFFITAILLLFVINIALATSLLAQIIGGLSLFLGIWLGAFLIRSVRNEERHHDELKSLTGQLTEANDHLREMDEAKDEFISIASHQLRTPVSVLKGYMSLMLEGAYGELSGTVKDKIEQMYGMNERLIHLINNILNMSRIEKNRLEFVCSYVSVPSVIEEVIAELQTKAKEKKLQLAFTRPVQELPRAYVDGDKVHEIAVNLIENAIKYSLKGSITVTIDVKKGEKGDEEIVLMVADTGIGMSSEDTKRVFQKFYRASNTFGVPRETGTGLGLYICAKFLDSMGGKIWIEKTESGKGTTFAVALPTKPEQRCVQPN